MQLLGAIIFFIMSFGMIFVGIKWIWRANKLVRKGIKTYAEVIQITEKKDSKGKIEHYYTLRFVAFGNKTMSIERTLQKAAKIGDKLEILYLPDNPSDFEFNDPIELKFKPFGMLLMGIILLIWMSFDLYFRINDLISWF